MPFYKKENDGTIKFANKPHGEDWFEYDMKTPPKEVVDVLLKDSKNKTLTDIETTYYTESTKPVPYKDVLYKGGDSSASAIAGAVNLAQSLGETNVKIIDINDDENFMSFSEALELSGMIAKSWRDAFFRYKELKRAVLAASSVEELELIKW
jgi:hypothetical protein